jgi:hypothetical protein
MGAYLGDSDEPRQSRKSKRLQLKGELEECKWILIIVGILQICISIYNFSQPFPSSVQVLSFIFILFAIGYIVLGVFIKEYPVPMTVTALATYVVAGLIDIVMLSSMRDSTMIVRGVVMKILISISLGKAVHTAFAYEQVRKRRQRFRDDDDVPRLRRRDDDDDRRRRDDDDDDRRRSRDDDDDRPRRRSRYDDNDDRPRGRSGADI